MSKLPLRIRLTLWYILSLGFILFLFATFLYLQLERSLLAQIDTSLQLATTQIIIDLHTSNDQLIFLNTDLPATAVHDLNEEFVIYLLAPDGTVWDKRGRKDDAPAAVATKPGYETIMRQGEPWRVYSQAIQNGSITGWIQVMRELDLMEQTLGDFLLQMMFAIPITFLLAGGGGFWLASRALRPIDLMTQTAQTITANDLNQRLDYKGPADEVGRLAATFDRMLDRLQNAFAHERQFTGDAAHELRTPLAALKGRIDVTLSKPRPPEMYIETLQEMEEQVDRLIRLSNDLLFIARLEQGQAIAFQEQIDVRDFLGAVVDQIRPLAEAKQITLHEAIPAGLRIYGDLDLLIRLFLNLLDNAVKYTPEKGCVTIQAEKNQHNLSITIMDTGPGIAPEHLPHLFERFYRAENARSRIGLTAGGAGLGLAIAYEITRAHGGTLGVESQLGQGTTFIVTFPQ